MKRVLCVGDGDLSYSLALQRCYGHSCSSTNSNPSMDDTTTIHKSNGLKVKVTASTLLSSRTKLFETYQNASKCFHALQNDYLVTSEESHDDVQNNSNVLFEIDATHLKESLARARHEVEQKYAVSSSFYDVIIFNHPHLDYDSLHLTDQRAHIHRHHVLLCHYFASAKEVSRYVHVSLCGDQPRSWRVLEAAEKAGLELVSWSNTSEPPHKTFLNFDKYNITPVDAKEEWKAPRKFRSGKLGSNHFLGRYGYTHRRTEGDVDMNVAKSVDLLFSKKGDVKLRGENMVLPNEWMIDDSRKDCNKIISDTPFKCNICCDMFRSAEDLVEHLRTPALPRTDAAFSWLCNKTGKKFHSAYALETFQAQSRTSNHKPSKRKIKKEENITKNDHVILNDDTGMTIFVDNLGNGKRLRWWCRQPESFGSVIQSKRQCDILVRNGGVKVNDEIAYDDSRILNEGDKVTILQREISALPTLMTQSKIENKKSSIKIEYENKYVIVAFKDSGIRVFGNIAGTFQMMLLSQISSKEALYPLSRLETGCPGLCAMAKSKRSFDVIEQHFDIKHTFIALVYGETEINFRSGSWETLPVSKARFWKKSEYEDMPKAINDNKDMGDEEYVAWHSQSSTMFIKCIDTAIVSSNGAKLSTLVITCCGRRGRLSHSIAQYFRTVTKTPIVGDSFCSKEFASLPRSCRTKMKGKLQIGCYELSATRKNDCTNDDDTLKQYEFHVSLPIPEKLLAKTWST